MRTEQQLRDALHILADRAPDPDDVLTRLHLPASTTSPPRSRRPVLIAATVVLALALVGAVALSHLTRRTTPDPATQRVQGNWAMVSHINPPSGWSRASYEISGSREKTYFSDATGKGVCFVEADGPGVAPTTAISTSAQPATVGTQAAMYQYTKVSGVPRQDAAVYWHYRADAWASVSCTTGPQGLGGARTRQEIRDLVIHLATTVTFGDYPVRLPIQIKQLPSGYSVQSISQANSPVSRDWGITLSPAHTSPTTPLISVAPAVGSIPAADTHVLGYPASFFTDGIRGPMTRVPRPEVSYTSLCIPTAPVKICVSATNTATDKPESRRQPFHDLASQITYATKPADTTTWFDAKDALPA